MSQPNLLELEAPIKICGETFVQGAAFNSIERLSGHLPLYNHEYTGAVCKHFQMPPLSHAA